jgi:hypothetical protein
MYVQIVFKFIQTFYIQLLSEEGFFRAKGVSLVKRAIENHGHTEEFGHNVEMDSQISRTHKYSS